MRKFIYLFLQIVLGMLFVTTAIGKLLDNRGFAEILVTYQLVNLTASNFLPFALMISLGELLLGYFILARKHMRIASGLTVLVYVGYLFIATISYYRGLALTNCGCFGVFWGRPLTWVTLVEDSILLFMSAVFWRLNSAKDLR